MDMSWIICRDMQSVGSSRSFVVGVLFRARDIDNRLWQLALPLFRASFQLGTACIYSVMNV